MPVACTKAQRCESGYCPVCIRLLRKKLLSFAERERLHELPWVYVTLCFKGWGIKPGDSSAFGKLRDHHLIKGVIRNLSRQPGPPLIVIGGIETVFITLNNEPLVKPMHIHVLVSGRSKEQIRKAVGNRILRTEGQPFPDHYADVEPTFDDFVKALSYSFKQPFWKKSRLRASDVGTKQFPKPNELRELAGNYGVHGWSGRLILCGVRFAGGRFEHTVNLSSTLKATEMTIGSKRLK